MGFEYDEDEIEQLRRMNREDVAANPHEAQRIQYQGGRQKGGCLVLVAALVGASNFFWISVGLANWLS